MGVGDDKVADINTCATLSAVEEQVSQDIGDCGAKKGRPRLCSVARGSEEELGQF